MGLLASAGNPHQTIAFKVSALMMRTRWGNRVMAFKEPRWGFWVPVKDKESAEYAAKMSGFPVFLMGLSFTPLGLLLVFAGEQVWQKIFGGVIAACGVFFIVSGLQIRKHKFKTLPVSVSIWLLLTVIAMFLALLSGSVPIGLNLLIGLMAISGLRGWWWLTRNPVLEPEDFS